MKACESCGRPYEEPKQNILLELFVMLFSLSILGVIWYSATHIDKEWCYKVVQLLVG